MKTAFLLTHVPDPKTNKRIEVFLPQGDVSVVCARRKSQDIWEPAYKSVKHYIFDVDLPTSKRPISRFVVSKKFQKKALLKLYELRPDVIYADGLDSLLIIDKYKKNNKCTVFFDVADLRETFIEPPKTIFNKVVVSLIRRIENMKFHNVDFLVITSQKFYDVHYKELIPSERVIMIPNAPDEEIFIEYKRKEEGTFKVGFIGGIRYLKQMKMLVDAAEVVGCHVLFAGAGGTSDDYKQISDYCKDKSFVEFTGKYNYNKDIARLYASVDCIYAVYDADNANVRIALPNKLYESTLCELPIIVAKNTYLAEMVKEWGVGVSVKHDDVDELINVLSQLMNDKELVDRLVSNCRNVKRRGMCKNNSSVLLDLIK